MGVAAREEDPLERGGASTEFGKPALLPAKRFRPFESSWRSTTFRALTLLCSLLESRLQSVSPMTDVDSSVGIRHDDGETVDESRH